jgi:hypothetical protein
LFFFWSTPLFKQKSGRGAWIKAQFNRESYIVIHFLELSPNILPLEPSSQYLMTIPRTKAHNTSIRFA